MSDEPLRDAWTQGLTDDLEYNGDFSVQEIKKMPLSRALYILRNMPPLPPELKHDIDYCPPQIGFGEDLAITIIDDGEYLVFPDDKICTLEEAEDYVRSIYGCK